MDPLKLFCGFAAAATHPADRTTPTEQLCPPPGFVLVCFSMLSQLCPINSPSSVPSIPSEDSDAHATDHTMRVAFVLLAETAGSSGCKVKRKKAFRFLPSSDTLLLNEMAKHTPWAVGHVETLVASDRLASADGKACRHRFAALLDAFRREEMESLRASGTTEDFTEREQLLTDIASLEKADKTKKKSREAERSKAASAEVVRDAMAGLPSKRPKRTSTELIVGYLETKAAVRSSRSEERKQQLYLEARRLAFEEHRLELDVTKGSWL
ncbi:hypothetical protein GQ600_22556 [Phytophthora cactorum]|nr:hypothetical protein GQ600_22556 [Phytophthora cactorum]